MVTQVTQKEINNMKNLKNWKMFLESVNENYDDNMGDEEKKDLAEMKETMMKSFEQLFIMEALVRPMIKTEADLGELTEVVDQVIGGLVTGIGQALMEDDVLPQDIKVKIAEAFSSSLMETRPTMIEVSFKEGIGTCIDEFIKIIVGIKKSMENEGEEWKEEKVKEYEDMEDSELRKLIDIALDDKDFGRVAKLSTFLSESMVMDTQVSNPEVAEAIDMVIPQFVSIILNYFLVGKLTESVDEHVNHIIQVKHLIEYLNQFDPEMRVGLDKEGWQGPNDGNWGVLYDTPLSVIKFTNLFDTGGGGNHMTINN